MTLVAGQQPDGPGKTRRRRNGAAIAVSLLAHIFVFALIGFNAPKLIAPNLTPLAATNIWLMPRLTLDQHKPADHKAASRAAAPPSKAKSAPAKPLAAAPTERAPAAPAAPSAIGAGRGPPAAPSATGAEDGVQEALRTSVGCDFEKNVHLTRAERDRCNQHYGEIARQTPAFSGIEPLKRGRFDDQAAADERRRAARTGPLQDLVIPCAGEGSNLGGGCLPDSAIAHLHPH